MEQESGWADGSHNLRGRTELTIIIAIYNPEGGAMVIYYVTDYVHDKETDLKGESAQIPNEESLSF